MNNTEKRDLVNKYGGWERLVIFISVILTAIIFTFMGTAIAGLFQGREGQGMGIMLSIVVTLILWAMVWGALWIISGLRSGSLVPPSASDLVLKELREENERLRKQLEEISHRRDDST